MNLLQGDLHSFHGGHRRSDQAWYFVGISIVPVVPGVYRGGGRISDHDSDLVPTGIVYGKEDGTK